MRTDLKQSLRRRVISGTLSAVMSLNMAAYLPASVFADEIPPVETNAVIERGGHKYMICDAPFTWEEAKAYCEQQGGHLMTATSSDEQLIIEELLEKGKKNSYWLGGYMSDDASWKWVTGESFDYANWASGQPDNYRRSENALMVYRGSNPMGSGGFGKWNDLSDDGTCNGEAFFGVQNFGFICEFDETEEDGFRFNGHKYQLFDDSMSWKEAKAYCESLGGHLVTITSEEEQQFLIDNLIPTGKKYTYFIGLYRDEETNQWKWVNGDAFDYTNWDRGEPNHADEHFVHMYAHIGNVGTWNNTYDYTAGTASYATANCGFICEWDLASEPVKPPVKPPVKKDKIKDYALFSASYTDNFGFSGWKSNINGNVYTGASFLYNGSELYINGRTDAVGSIITNGWKMELNERNETAAPVDMPDYDKIIHDNADPCETYDKSITFIEDRTVVGTSIKSSGDITISSTTFEGDCYIIADGNITYNINDFNTKGRVFLYSRYGNITINGTHIRFNGGIYAPKGNVSFNTYETDLDGFVWADSITYSGSILNVNAANFDMAEPRSIVKTYTLNADFNEGQYSGLGLDLPDALTLNAGAGKESPLAESVYGDTENGKGVKVTCSADKSTVAKTGGDVTVKYGLSGFGEADVAENAVDLIILVDESWSMEDYDRMTHAKTAAREIVKQMKPTDRCAVMGFSWSIHDVQGFTSDKELLDTAITNIRFADGTDIANGLNNALRKFDDSDRQKYIILLSDGEDSTNSAAAAKAAAAMGVRIFTLMIGSGTLQMQNIAINSNGIYKNAPTSEEIVKIMSYFASEVFNVAGRNTTFKTTVRNADSVDISAVSPAPSKVTENEDGSVTLEWSFDRITIDETKEISIPVSVAAGTEGFADLLENTSCVYYDRGGKPNVVYADDVSLPVSGYAENGSWTAVFDSERAATEWESLRWNGCRYGDSTITVYVSASEDGETFSAPVKAENQEPFSGITGRYVKISVDMTVSADGKSPALYDITLASKDASLDDIINNAPAVSVACKNKTKVGVPMRLRAVLSDDCLESDLTAAWSCEDENVRFSGTEGLLTSVVCAEAGSYDVVLTVSDGEKTVKTVKTVVCEPADSYADIDPEHENEAAAPKISVALPEYADRKETIRAKIEKLNDTEISWYSVIFNGNTAVSVTDDGEFTLTMPNKDGSFPVVVRAFDWSGKSDVKEYTIKVDSTAAAVSIVPSSPDALTGSDAYFKVSAAGVHKIKELSYTLNGEPVEIPEDGILPVDTASAGEYVLEAHGLTTADKEISASGKITVIEADTEKPAVKITFDKASYNENQKAVITVTATDNVGVTDLTVLLNGKEITLNSSGKYTVSGLKMGDYIVTANASDAAGNIGTATEKFTAKDVTKPSLTLTADKTAVKVGEKVTLTVKASDNNGEVSTTLYAGEEQLTIAEDGTAVFTPEKAGTCTIKAIAADPSGNKTEKSLKITAEEADSVAPVVKITFDKDTYIEKDDILFTVVTSDNVGVVKTVMYIDGEEVPFEGNGTYQISNAQKKTYEITVTAYDAENNEGTASASVIVSEAKAPVISVTFDKDMYIEGDTLAGFVKAEGSRPIASLTAKLNGEALALEDGRFSVSDLKEGTYQFTFTAADTAGLTTEIEKTVNVFSKEQEDTRLLAFIDKQVRLGDTAELRILASAEIDKSTVSAKLNGEAITLDSNLKYQFKAEKLFNNVFEISAKTNSGETLTLNLTVLVYETNKPKIGLVFTAHEDGYHYAHDDITGTLTVTDESGIQSVHVYYDGNELPIDEDNHVYINDFVVANHTVIVRAVDNFGNVAVSGLVFYTVEVSGGSASGSESTDLDSNALNAVIYAPADGGSVSGVDYVIGRADGTNFDHFELLYASMEDRKGILLAQGTKPVNNAILGEFDTTLLRNGSYILQLTVYDKDGNSTSARSFVSVEGNAKIGNFSVGFEDLTINSAASPLTLSRIYDSRDRNVSGDFGYGWSQAVKNVRVYTNGPLYYGWKMDIDWRQGAVYSPTRPHIITVDWGNGKTDKFTVTAKLRNDLGLGYSAGMYFTPLDGTTSSLSAEGAPGTYMCSQGYMMDDDDGTFFEPENFTLTTAEGTKYALNIHSGLSSITDKNGQVLRFVNGKIEGTNGSLDITRDASGRITGAKTPSGSEVSYTYDENGDLASFTDVSGNTTTFTYKNHFLEEIIDPRGVRVSKNIYDEDGRLIKTVDADGNEITYAHDIYGREETVTDKNGGVTRYVYDQYGNVLSLTDPMGNTVTSTYDSLGNILTKKDAMGNETTYTYNNGTVATLTDAEGNVVENVYSTNGMLQSVKAMGSDIITFSYDSKTNEVTGITDANGNTTTYDYEGKNLVSVSDNIGSYLNMTYNSDGEVVSITNGIGTVTDFTYDEKGNCSSKTVKFTLDGKAKTYTEYYQYDEEGNLTQFTDSLGNVTKTVYNSLGKIASATDQNGNQTKYTYDKVGNLTQISYADGTSESFTYDPEGNALSATNRYGVKVTMTYDKVGNLLSKTYPNGASTTYEYNKNYQLISETSPAGAVTSYEYDKIGRNIAITDAFNNKTAFTYNAKSQLSAMKDAKGNLYLYDYDANGNRIKTTYPDGSSVSAAYDQRDRMISQTDQNGYTTAYTYDAADRLTLVQDALGNETAYTYDEVGDLLSVTDANGHTTKYSYDECGRVVKVTNALGKTAEITYDKAGNVLESTDFAGKKTTFTYDKFDRLKSTKTADGTVTYSYTADGMIDSVKDASGTTAYTYDSMGTLTKVTYPSGRYVSYIYDDAFRMTGIKTETGSVTYGWDAMNRLVRVIDRNGNATVYEYDKNGNRSKVRYANGITVSYEYDDLNRLIKEKALDKEGGLVAQYEYTLGKAGERTKVKEIDRTVSYTYDKLYRLTSETVTEGAKTTAYTYTYDKVGNRLTKTAGDTETAYTYNALNQLVSENDTVYAYDAAGNLISVTADTKTTRYTYNASNKMIRATVQEGNSVTIEEYEYDYAGNRTVKKSENDYTYYLNDVSGSLTQVLAELDADGNEKCWYTRGAELVSQERDGAVSYYLADGHGSVRKLTDASGAVTDTYTFDAWGVMTASNGVTKNDYLYCGEQYDAFTGYYYLRARYMDPATGTFTTMDTYQGSIFDPVSLHKYLYANANPVTNIDPSGYCTLFELNVTEAINNILDKWNDTWVMRTYRKLKKQIEVIDRLLTIYDVIRQAQSWLTDPDASAIEVLFGIAGGVISGIFLKKMCNIKELGKVIKSIVLIGGYASQIKAISDAVKNGQWDEVISQTFHLTVSILALSNNCFTGDTLVATEDGQKRIDEINVGDKVWAYDIFTGENALKEVTTVYVHEVNEILHLHTTCGDIDTTTNHPFYVLEKGWVAAGDLCEGDAVYLIDGTTAFVTGAELEKLAEKILVYNLEVADFDTYFVGENAVLVHNYGPNGSKKWSKYDPDNMPEEIHHIATNKDEYYTPDFEAIAQKYGLSLDGPYLSPNGEEHWNQMTIKHRGKHVWEYHDFILEQMEKIDSIANGNVDIFLEKWGLLKGLLAENPQMLYSEFWRAP